MRHEEVDGGSNNPSTKSNEKSENLILVYETKHTLRKTHIFLLQVIVALLQIMIMQVKTVKLAAALDIGGFGVVYAVARFAINELDLRIMVIGTICACLNVLMYGSPLAAMVSFSSHIYILIDQSSFLSLLMHDALFVCRTWILRCTFFFHFLFIVKTVYVHETSRSFTMIVKFNL